MFLDIDECDEQVDPNLCDKDNGFCTNQLGSYSCQCFDGYYLAADGKNCLRTFNSSYMYLARCVVSQFRFIEDW